MTAPELSGLPETMRAIVYLIGLDDAILLVRELGGRHLYVAVHGKYGQCVSERLFSAAYSAVHTSLSAR